MKCFLRLFCQLETPAREKFMSTQQRQVVTNDVCGINDVLFGEMD